jgi:hypothetical protein
MEHTVSIIRAGWKTRQRVLPTSLCPFTSLRDVIVTADTVRIGVSRQCDRSELHSQRIKSKLNSEKRKCNFVGGEANGG